MLSKIWRELKRPRYHVKRWFVLSISIILLLLFYSFRNTSFLVRAISAILLLLAFYAADHIFYLKFKSHHYLYILIIASTGALFSPLYYIYSSYDKVLHFILPIMLSSIFFFMISRLQLESKWKLVFTFFTVLGSLALFEIGEFALDYFFNLKLQGVFLRSIQGLEKYSLILDRNDDTMIDLIFGVLGSFAYFLTRLFTLKKISEYG